MAAIGHFTTISEDQWDGMARPLTYSTKTASALGVREFDAVIQAGKVSEGDVVGKLVILNLAQDQELPFSVLRDIYLSAGLDESDLPRERCASNAWRVATTELNGKQFVSSRFGGVVRVLVRDWAGGRDPRRDITLERQNAGNDRFEYASPAVVITFDSENERMAWDNRSYEPALEEMLDGARQRFEELRRVVNNKNIYDSLLRIIERTVPLPMGRGAFLIWKEHAGVVKAVSSVIAALNSYNPSADSMSVANIFTVVNTPEDRETLSTSLDVTIKREVEQALERMGKIMRDPTRLFDSQGKMELENYESLKTLVDEFDARFNKDRRALDTQLQLLLDQHMDLMTAIAKNNARKAKEKAGRVA